MSTDGTYHRVPREGLTLSNSFGSGLDDPAHDPTIVLRKSSRTNDSHFSEIQHGNNSVGFQRKRRTAQRGPVSEVLASAVDKGECGEEDANLDDLCGHQAPRQIHLNTQTPEKQVVQRHSTPPGSYGKPSQTILFSRISGSLSEPGRRALLPQLSRRPRVHPQVPLGRPRRPIS